MKNVYKKLPIEIEAWQITEEEIDDVAYWCKGYVVGDQIYVYTLEGMMKADYGDYIICGVEGEFYPCKPDIFKQTYVRKAICKEMIR
jgi:hypothetical protein